MMCLSLLVPLAQAIPPPPVRTTPPGEVRMWAQGGWDPTTQLGLGVGGPLPSPEAVDVRWESALDLPVFLVARGIPSLGLGAGPTVRWDADRTFVSGSAYGTLHSAQDVTGTRVAFGTQLVARAGLTGGEGRRALALEGQWSAAWATYTAPSDGVADLYGDRPGSAVQEPGRGFYAGTAHRLRGGLAGAVAVSSSVALHMALGVAHTPHIDGLWFDVPVAPMPLYAHVGVAVQP